MKQENTPPTNALVRTTISVRPEVLDAFRRLCDVSGTSLSRGIGDWLADTVEAAEAMADLVEKAREQPKMVARQLQGYALGLSDMTSDLLDELRKRSSAGIAADTPPVGNTGGKLPQTPKKRRGKDA